MTTAKARPNLTATPTSELALLRQAVEATRGALIITDNTKKDNPIVFANKAFYELTGYGPKEVIGFNCRFLQGTDTDPETVGILRDAVSKNKEARVTIKNYRKDGTMFWNDLLMSPIKDDTGKYSHFIGMQLDITERIEYEAALREGQERLRRSNQELEQFTYAASHDLQEPLRMVRSFMQLIEQRYSDKLDEDGKSFVQFAVEGSTRMQNLVNDLLSLSQVRTRGREPAVFALNLAVDGAISNLRASISESDAKIDYDPDMPDVCADRSQLVQLFQNLISNGIKYHRSNVRPHIKITTRTTADNSLQVSVSDNGIGIDEQYFERVFGVFQRLHTREEYPGTGVGLAVCKKIVERQGGQIWLESKPGKGSTFHFTVPLAKKGGSK